jgi:hypothetical protein
MKSLTVVFLAFLSLTVPLAAFLLVMTMKSHGLSQEPSTISTAVQAPARALELKTDGTGHIPEEQIQELLRIVVDKDLENDRKGRDYTYVQRKERRELSRDGKVNSIETETHEVLTIYDQGIERLIAKNDKPLSEKEAASEEQRIQKIIDTRKRESEEEHNKRLAKAAKQREEERKLVLEAADAYDFRLLRTERLDGRDTWVIDAEPRPQYKPRSKEASILPNFRFRAWIDQSDLQLAKFDATCIETASFGWFVVRIRKGTRVIIEQMRVNDQVWLPKHVDAKIDMGIGLLKRYDSEEETSYRDYKRFRTDAKILKVSGAR